MVLYKKGTNFSMEEAGNNLVPVIHKKKSKKNQRIATIGQVKRLINHDEEVKWFDTTLTLTPSYNGQIQDLTPIAQGDGENYRDGSECILKSVEMRYKINSYDNPGNLFRVILFRWKPDSALVAPAWTSVCYTNGSYYAPLSPYNSDYRDQFTIVYDKLHSVDTVTNIQLARTLKIKLSKIKVKFSATSTEGSNKLYLAVCSDSASTGHPPILFNCRVRYTDS